MAGTYINALQLCGSLAKADVLHVEFVDPPDEEREKQRHGRQGHIPFGQ